MTVSTKPADLPEWATSGSAEITEPVLSKKQLGWVAEIPPHDFFNWWWNKVYQWVKYLNDFEAHDFTWTGANDFSAATLFKAPVAVWTAMSSFGTFSGIGTPFVPGCWVDPSGFVHVKGQIGKASSSSAGEAACTLPFHPDVEQRFIVHGATGAGDVAVPVKISTSGVLTVGVALTYTSSTTNVLTLDGIIFSLNH